MTYVQMNLWSGIMNSSPDIRITNAFFANNLLTVAMSDGRIVIFPCHQLKWLINASPEQQQYFSIESDGYGIWWHELDDGVALHHLLSPIPVVPTELTA